MDGAMVSFFCSDATEDHSKVASVRRINFVILNPTSYKIKKVPLTWIEHLQA